MGPMGICTLTEAADYGRNDYLKTPRKNHENLQSNGQIDHLVDVYTISTIRTVLLFGYELKKYNNDYDNHRDHPIVIINIIFTDHLHGSSIIIIIIIIM